MWLFTVIDLSWKLWGIFGACSQFLFRYGNFNRFNGRNAKQFPFHSADKGSIHFGSRSCYVYIFARPIIAKPFPHPKWYSAIETCQRLQSDSYIGRGISISPYLPNLGCTGCAATERFILGILASEGFLVRVHKACSDAQRKWNSL